MYQRVILIGRLGADAEVRMAGDKPVANLRLAVYAGPNKTEWVPVVAWEKQAETARDLKKGQLVFVEGTLQTRSYQKDGETRYITEIRAQKVLRFEKGAPREEEASSDERPF